MAIFNSYVQLPEGRLHLWISLVIQETIEAIAEVADLPS